MRDRKEIEAATRASLGWPPETQALHRTSLIIELALDIRDMVEAIYELKIKWENHKQASL